MSQRLTTALMSLALAGAVLAAPSAGPAAGSGGDGAYPLKNTTYTGKGDVASHGYTLVVKIKIGNNVQKVDKLTAKLRCPEGKQKIIRRNLDIDASGNIRWDERDPEDFGGQFTTKHKVDRGYVQGDPAKPCSTYVVEFIAKD